MREIKFTPTGFEQYNEWAISNKKIFIKVGKLINECTKTPFTGTGKPEALKHELKGYWSRRITNEHRLIYKVDEMAITIIACIYHYQ
jgi:toxin YoeB